MLSDRQREQTCTENIKVQLYLDIASTQKEIIHIKVGVICRYIHIGRKRHEEHA